MPITMMRKRLQIWPPPASLFPFHLFENRSDQSPEIAPVFHARVRSEERLTWDLDNDLTSSNAALAHARRANAETVIRRADACLYGAKHSGRNLVIHQNDPRMAALETSAA